MEHYFTYLLICAGITYLVRAIPLLLIKKRITNRYVLSFMHYMPASILTVMTIPAIFYATDSLLACTAAFVSAFIAAYKGKSLIVVALIGSLAVILIQLAVTYIF